MAIEPDTKDWTWVLERSCDECGFDPTSVTRETLPTRVRAATQVVHGALHDADARDRPGPSTWSKLEYAAHVRDVCIVMRRRLEQVLAHDGAAFDDWDQDAAAVERRYDEQRPPRVAIELDVAAAELAEALAAVPDDAWEHRGLRSNGSAFTTFTLGAYALHDLEHHAWDVTGERAR